MSTSIIIEPDFLTDLKISSANANARFDEMLEDDLTYPWPERYILYPYEFHTFFRPSMAGSSKWISKEVSEWLLHRLFTYDIITMTQSTLQRLFLLSPVKRYNAGVLAKIYNEEADVYMGEITDYWKQHFKSQNFETFKSHLYSLIRPSYNKELIRVSKMLNKYIDKLFGKASVKSSTNKRVVAKRSATKAPKRKSTDVKRTAAKRTSAAKKSKGKTGCGGAFFRFLSEHRSSIMQEHGVTKQSEVAKIGGEMWRRLTADEKKVYCQ